ncbi:MAG: heat-inducible transcription repressor HrcA [Anaerolineae bacterium]|nr:heat-inducible transcription repressor HrcA [Anaerolineae bacterium]
MALEPQPENGVILTPRQRDILKIVVERYIDTAAPVGSSSVQSAGSLGMSTATIRNELVALENAGYLTQPYTSAGRVPTAQGYRYYVEHLIERTDLPVPEQRMIQHQFHQLRLDMDQWARLTAAVLAHTARAASLVTPPHATNARFRHLELISINDATCLMILVLQDGSIHQEMLMLSDVIDQDELSKISSRLNSLLFGMTLREIQASTHPELTALRGIAASVLDRVLPVMRGAERRATHEIYRDGLLQVLGEPEFVDVEKREQILRLFEQQRLLDAILTRMLGASGIQIIIGSEGAYGGFEDLSMILSPYGLRGKASGVLGVLGPTRMAYGRGISAVRYVTALMDQLIQDVFGN